MLEIVTQNSRRAIAAFTIVELLIVIAIIGILATVVSVSYNGVRHRAEVIVVMTDLQNLSDEMKFFYKDNDRYPIVYPEPYSDPLLELETILKTANVFEDTRKPDPKKTFIFCAPTRTNPQRFAIIGREFGESSVDEDNPILHYVTSDSNPSSTPMVWDDAITAADPGGKYGSNACNTVSLKTGYTYFSTGNMRWSFDVPLVQ